ncbi:hypothetical protein PSACC_03015 [Paramicrosporidium saccamoebae]|uniref:Uncharacterized protein n=1 Tax=Paramicrosporidium saccamoebae TaxID=1246581 RepID=A0A2H9THE1_9FUNG|nr:hypothetical protein PSACC_03015 [Paramicrosporidium saccamoebae]
MPGPGETGMLNRAAETVSETLHGAVEGLRHGTQVVMGTTVEGKEGIRGGLHDMTTEPTPRNPSYADQAKDSIVSGVESSKESLDETTKVPIEKHNVRLQADPDVPLMERIKDTFRESHDKSQGGSPQLTQHPHRSKYV